MLKITWLGHACWMLDTGSMKVLVDPFLSQSPTASCSPEQVEADVVLITHGHVDHILDAAAIAKRCDSLCVANYEIATWLASKQGVARTIGMNLGGWAKLPEGRVKMTIAHHSSELPDGTYGGQPGGFLLELPAGRVYVAGDTALFSDMQWISPSGIDVAILPIGDLFTMGPEDSLQAIEWLKPSCVFPSHFNTWPPIAQDATQWARQVRERSRAIPQLLQPGDSATWSPQPLDRS